MDEDEEILWNFVLKNNYSDIILFEERFDIIFYFLIDCYFNFYWFVELDGFMDSYYFMLEVVLLNIELDMFERNLKGYKINYDKFDMISLIRFL